MDLLQGTGCFSWPVLPEGVRGFNAREEIWNSTNLCYDYYWLFSPGGAGCFSWKHFRIFRKWKGIYRLWRKLISRSHKKTPSPWVDVWSLNAARSQSSTYCTAHSNSGRVEELASFTMYRDYITHFFLKPIPMRSARMMWQLWTLPNTTVTFQKYSKRNVYLFVPGGLHGKRC